MPATKHGRRKSTRTSADRVATIPQLAKLKFQPLVLDDSMGTFLLQDWLERSRHEFFLYQVVLAVLEKDDVELSEFVRGLSVDTLSEICQSLVTQIDVYRGGKKSCQSAEARLLASMARVVVEAETEVRA